MSSVAPHPYTLGALHSHAETSGATSTPSHTQHNNEVREFSAESRTCTQRTVGHQYLQPSGPLDSYYGAQPLPLHLRPPVLLLVFLPIPPLLSLVYMAIDHALLREAYPSSASIFRAPTLTSAEAGATGGVILALPLALLLCIIPLTNNPPTVPEDFFEDDDPAVERQARLRGTGYAACFILVFAIGGVAGPLGVACLSSGTLNVFIENKNMLSTSAAAAAGFLGGAIMSFGTFACGILFWMLWRHQRKP